MYMIKHLYEHQCAQASFIPIVNLLETKSEQVWNTLHGHTQLSLSPSEPLLCMHHCDPSQGHSYRNPRPECFQLRPSGTALGLIGPILPTETICSRPAGARRTWDVPLTQQRWAAATGMAGRFKLGLRIITGVFDNSQ